MNIENREFGTNESSVEEKKVCSCNIVNDCRIDGSKCECNGVCVLYEDLLVLHRGTEDPRRKKHFTISPRPRIGLSRDEEYRTWKQEFTTLSKYCSMILVTCELNSSNNLHFHGVAVVSDLFMFTRKMRKLSQFDNCKDHGSFAGGYHYLFKDYHYTSACINSKKKIEHEVVMISKS